MKTMRHWTLKIKSSLKALEKVLSLTMSYEIKIRTCKNI